MTDAALARARTLVGGLLAGPLILAAVLLALGGESRTARFDMPAALAGLVALPVAWRLHAALLDRARRRHDPAGRLEGFVTAIVVALAVTEFAALFGLIAFKLSREALPLVGLAMHVILGGVLWPSRERLDAFVHGPDSAAP